MYRPFLDTGTDDFPDGCRVHQFITVSFAGEASRKSCNGGHMTPCARRGPPRNVYFCSNYFLAAVFWAGAFLAALFAGAFLAALGAAFLAGAFLATDFF